MRSAPIAGRRPRTGGLCFDRAHGASAASLSRAYCRTPSRVAGPGRPARAPESTARPSTRPRPCQASGRP